jgi:hypothetical protein
MPRRVKGEVFTLPDWLRFLLLFFFWSGLVFFVLLTLGSFFAWLGLGGIPQLVIFLHLAFITILEGWVVWYLMARNPAYVFGTDRVQCWAGDELRWEAYYADLEPPELLAGPRTPALLGRCVALRLTGLEWFDHSWPLETWERARNRRRCGFDLLIPTLLLPESPERIHETLLTCYERFQRGEAPTPPSRGRRGPDEPDTRIKAPPP